MSQVRSSQTGPELLVQMLLALMGFHFNINDRTLPGSPDITFTNLKKAIFVHGCFWHGHKNCNRSKRPATNKAFWSRKLDTNLKRDIEARKTLKKLGWQSIVIWQCQLKRLDLVAFKISYFLEVR